MALRHALLALAVLLPTAALTACSDDDEKAAQRLTVYAAASLRDSLPAIDESPRYDFAGSGQLQLRIERGAPADLFLSASPKEARALFSAGRCEQPVAFATNRLVLVVPPGNPSKVRSAYSLRSGGRRLAIGSAGVPIGDYTRRLLRLMGLSSVLERNVVSGEASVSGVVSKVALGSADAGFVYVTDARAADGRLDQVALPSGVQPAVRYEGCAVRRPGANRSGAAAYLESLRGDRGRTVLRRNGFGLPPGGG